MRAKGLEPPHLAIPEPKSGASTNFATPACPNEAARKTIRSPARVRTGPLEPLEQKGKRQRATYQHACFVIKTRLWALAMSEETPNTDNANDVPPDHLSVNPRSPAFNADVLQRGVGIKFKDRVRTDIEEYSISGGWVRVQTGKTVDRKGNPLTIKLNGPVEAWFEDLGDEPPVAKKG